jgi:hypothetical protein
MKKQFSLLFLSVLFIFGCSNESIQETNDELLASKFIEILENPAFQITIASHSAQSGTRVSQRSGLDAIDDAYILQSVHGLVYIQFTDTKVFAFMGVGRDRLKEKNGEVHFNTQSKRAFCAVGNPLTREVEFSNVCPINANGSLIANGRLMPGDKIADIEFIGALYAVNGASLINAKNIHVNDADVQYIPPTEANSFSEKIDCVQNSSENKIVSLKSETDVNGNNIELTYSLN